MQSNILSSGLILAWLITPESIRLVNMGAGMSGVWYLLSLVLGAVLAIFCAKQMYSPQLAKNGLNSESKILSRVFGRTIAVAILFFGRLPFLLFASTGLLVTAGFAFNEVFVYWFPNFLFASILLIVIAALNLFAEPIVLRFQFVFTTVAVSGLLLLIIMGLLGESTTQDYLAAPGYGLNISLLAMGFVTFLGFDFHKTGENNKIVVLCLLVGLLVVAGWTFIALKFVAPTRLAESYIAYMFVAKAVGGEVGRYIMGVIVIFGVLSCVNALFILLRRLFNDLMEEPALPHFINKGWMITLFFALIIEVMMLTGFAGEKILDTQIHASIILWLLYLGIRTGSTFFILKQANSNLGGAGYIAGVAVIVVTGVLFFPNPQIFYIAKFLLMVLVGAFMFSLIWTRVYNKYSLNP